MPSPKVHALLAYLALAEGAKPRSELLALLWRHGKPANLRYALHKLREVPGSDEWLEARSAYVRVDATTDVGRLELAVQNARISDVLDVLEDGHADPTLLLGLELPDAPRFSAWLDHERSRLEGSCHDALVQAAERLASDGDAERGVPLVRRLLERDPLDEAVHRAAMRLAHARGDAEAALERFETCRTLLRDELGVEPSPETLALVAEIEGPAIAVGEAARLLLPESDVPSLPQRLIGRTAALERARASVESGERLLLHGMGGAGTSALAATLAREHLSTGRRRVLWVQVGHGAPDELFDAAARALDAHGAVSRAADRRIAVRDGIAAARVGLVILDDVWSVYAMSKLVEAVPDGVPVVVTSRQRLPGIARIEVGRLARPDAMELLVHHAGAGVREDPDADALCETLADHAFAIRLAGISLRLEGESAHGLLGRMGAAPHALRLPAEWVERGRSSVMELLHASLETLSEGSFEAFMAIGALYAPSVTPDLLAAFLRRDRSDVEQALFDVRTRGLAERWAVAGSDVVSYRLHDLAFSLARANHHHRPATAERACLAFLADHHRDFDAVDAELANLLGAARSFAAHADDERLVEAMRRLAVWDAYFRARGHTPGSFELLRAARDAAGRLGAIETAQATAARIGDAYREQYGDYEAAAEAYGDALDLARAGGDEHREIVMMTLLGTTLSQRGSGDTERWLDEAERLARARGDDRALCQVLEHRGCLAVREGRFDDAMPWFRSGREAVQRLERSVSVDDAEVARLSFFLLLNEGEAERGAGHLDRALDRRREALVLAEGLGNPLWTAYALQELGETHHERAERSEAQRTLACAYEIYREHGVVAAIAGLDAFMADAGYDVPRSPDA